MMQPPGGGAPPSPQAAAPPAPGAGGPPGAGGGSALPPQKIQKLAQALDPENADTLIQVLNAILKDAVGAIHQAAGQSGQQQPGAAPPPGGPPPGGPAGGGAPKPPAQLPPKQGMMGQV